MAGSPGGQVRQGEHTPDGGLESAGAEGPSNGRLPWFSATVAQQLVLVDVTVRSERADELAVALHLYGHRPH